jgi:hypothetical protein
MSSLKPVGLIDTVALARTVYQVVQNEWFNERALNHQDEGRSM